MDSTVEVSRPANRCMGLVLNLSVFSTSMASYDLGRDPQKFGNSSIMAFYCKIHFGLITPLTVVQCVREERCVDRIRNLGNKQFPRT